MSNKIVKSSSNILESMNRFIEDTGLQDAKTIFNAKNGTATISGNRDGVQYTTTMKKCKAGIVKTDSIFETNLGKSGLTDQIQDLSKQGYKQVEIANMLGVSQSLVSKYLKRKKVVEYGKIRT